MAHEHCQNDLCEEGTILVHTGDTADQNKTVWKVLFTYYVLDNSYCGQLTAGDLEIGIFAIPVALVL